MSRRIREARYWKKNADPYRRPPKNHLNETGKKIRAEEKVIQDRLCTENPGDNGLPGADCCYTGIVRRLYRQYVREHGFCPVTELSGDDWAVLFRGKLEELLTKGNPYSKGQYTSTAYFTIANAVHAVEVCFHVTIDRKTVKLEKVLHCKTCGAVLVPVGSHLIGCPACNTAARPYPGTNIPSGVPVGPMIRACRAILHQNFDPLWKNGGRHAEEYPRRQAAYQVLAKYAGLPIDRVHFSRILGLKDASRLMDAVNEMRKAEGLPVHDIIRPDGTCLRDGKVVHEALWKMEFNNEDDEEDE